MTLYPFLHPNPIHHPISHTLTRHPNSHIFLSSNPRRLHSISSLLPLQLYISRPLFMLNHAVNFFLYIISGRAFRAEFLQMIRDWKRFISQWFCCCFSCRCCSFCCHRRRGEADFNTDRDRRKSSWIPLTSKLTTRTNL